MMMNVYSHITFSEEFVRTRLCPACFCLDTDHIHLGSAFSLLLGFHLASWACSVYSQHKVLFQ